MINKIIATLLLLFLSPLLIIISIAILINDGSPILYKQKVLGINHKPFFLFKFRTMYINSPVIPTQEMIDAKRYIFPLGKKLRKYSLDELPQFYNVIRGDMNFIGPRPCLANNEETVKYLREQKNLHKIKPGITGLAQVQGRDSNNYEKKVELDYQYLKSKNFILDCKIISKTIFAILFPKNIKH